MAAPAAFPAGASPVCTPPRGVTSTWATVGVAVAVTVVVTVGLGLPLGVGLPDVPGLGLCPPSDGPGDGLSLPFPPPSPFPPLPLLGDTLGVDEGPPLPGPFDGLPAPPSLITTRIAVGLFTAVQVTRNWLGGSSSSSVTTRKPSTIAHLSSVFVISSVCSPYGRPRTLQRVWLPRFTTVTGLPFSSLEASACCGTPGRPSILNSSRPAR